MAMPASKHGDPQLGIDIHFCIVPPSPSPVPLPTPHISVVFDPFDYVPFIGGTVTVCGMKRATAGTSGIVIHIPPGFPFAPKFPDFQDELFMGSATVVADGDPFSFIAVPVLGCQIVGMPSIPRLKKKGPKKFMLLPTTFNLAIPTSVVVGGPPTISMMGLAMKGAFAALGKFAKSGLFKRIRQKLFGHLKPSFLKCAILRAEPVNIVTGDVEVEQVDFTVPGRIPIEWVRSYASSNRRAGACGPGWDTPADGRLEVDTANDVVLMQYPSVGPLCFARLPLGQGDEAAEIELMDGARLIDRGTEYCVHTKADRVYHFRKDLGFIREDGVHEIPLGRISDLCGNWLEFERRDRRAVAIAESAGRRVHLRLDRGRIVDIAMTVLATDAAHRFVSYEYDAEGDLTTVVDALGHPYVFEYAQHHLVRHTDRNGLSFYYEYDQTTDPQAWRVVRSWGDGNLYNYRFEYVDSLQQRRITDSLGHVAVVTLDDRGLPISELDPLGGLTAYQYDEAGRATAVIDQDSHQTTFEYDVLGNLTKMTRGDGSVVETAYSAESKAVRITDANGGDWQQQWDSRGLLVRQITPLGNTSTFEYDRGGQLVAFVDPREARTELGYDGFANLIVLVDALGRATRFEYDVIGNLIATSDAAGRHTRYRYDAMRRLAEAVLPSGARMSCEYDREGNLVRFIDENGAETRNEYVGLGELARRTQADGHVVEYDYDTEERLIAVTNQRGETYQLVRDGLGRIVRETDYWGQSRTYAYTASGFLDRCIDERGGLIAYETDGVGRIRSKALPPHEEAPPFAETYEYDGNGNVLVAENPDIRIEREYDGEGRLTEERQGTAFTVQNVYDAAGNRIERRVLVTSGTAARITSVSYEFDRLDQMSAVRCDEHPAIELRRNEVGLVTDERFGSSLRRETSYDADVHIVRQLMSTVSDTVAESEYVYDGVGNLLERRDAAFGIDRFVYDPVGRIVTRIDPRAALKEYFNDPAGDRLRTHPSARPPHTDDTMPETASSVATAVATVESSWSREGTYEGAWYAFDAAGCLTHRSDQRGDLRLIWDAGQRLVETQLADERTRYVYDAFKRRVAKRTAERTVQFCWDDDALALEEDPASDEGRRLREWVYHPGSFEPLLVTHYDLDADRDSAYVFQNDPNGCPVRLIDFSGRVVWAAEYSAWGAVERLATGDVDNPLRLQGQFYDDETGLHYNRFRYFEPHIGQYASKDPLGLAPDDNVYSMVVNTFGAIDPLGLKCTRLVKEGGQTVLEVLNKFPPGSPQSRQLQRFIKAWNEEIAKNGGSMTRRVLDDLEEAASQKWKKQMRDQFPGRFRGKVVGHVPDACAGGPVAGGRAMALSNSVNSYLGGVLGGVPDGTTYDTVRLFR